MGKKGMEKLPFLQAIYLQCTIIKIGAQRAQRSLFAQPNGHPLQDYYYFCSK